VERVSTVDEGAAGSNGVSARELMRATLRFNTLVFGLILGLLAGTALLVLAVVASGEREIGRLTVFLIGIFLPGYTPGWPGALVDFGAGFIVGAALGAFIYRINSLRVLSQLDQLIVAQKGAAGVRAAVLKLHGPSLGLAIGAAGALGLIATTNMLVARGTAGESRHARLLGEVLPGYTVSPVGSLVGAIELFAVLYVFCHAFALIYNSLAGKLTRR